MIAIRARHLGFLAMVMSVFAATAISQSPSASSPTDVTTVSVLEPNASPAPSMPIETWFGWIETSKQQLRTFVKIKRDSIGKVVSGSMLSPDETSSEFSWSEFEINNDGKWEFTIASPIATQPRIQFIGTQTSADTVKGTINRGDENVVWNLQKLNTVPVETPETLGADSVWRGTIDLVVRKVELRVREYSTPPYGSPASPRFVFDSITQNIPGVPAQLTTAADGKRTLEIKNIDAKFVGRLNDAGDEWEGRFTQGKLPLKLLLKRQTAASIAEANDSNKLLHPSPADSEEIKKGTNEQIAKSSGPAANPPPTIQRTSTEFYDEMPFEVVVVKPVIKKGKENEVVNPGVILRGTLTIPKQKADEKRAFPAVVMVTGSGPQDRDETIGKHKPFQAISHYLAKIGIASLRYDDRGVGESTGDYYNATTEDFAKDALAVWSLAKTAPEIDANKIGLLGHSEGALIGPMVAVWEPEVAFLILIAPPGLTGSEVLKTQIDRISELQGMSPEDRKTTMALQSRLQEIASGYFIDESTMRRDIQTAIRQSWDGLKAIAKSQDPMVDLEKLRRQLSEQIELQFQQLRMPWYQYYLGYDPTPNWMMLRCPTLALWGENDAIILPADNRDKLKVAIQRNPDIDVQMSILPGLNHLLQTSKTGLPDEYEANDETIAPAALELIRSWAEEHGVIEK